jgi:hypothetical protein
MRLVQGNIPIFWMLAGAGKYSNILDAGWCREEK